MQAAGLITRVRLFLKDVTSDSIKGEFWSDDEIELSLNVSQDIFVNMCLSDEKYHMLNTLIRNSGFSAGALDLTSLTSSYLHYMSAKVGGTADTVKMAQIYLGGTGWGFWNTDHLAAIIIRNTCTFIENKIPSGGILYYYKRPAVITTDTGDAEYNVQDFEDYVYNDIIAKHAAVMCGMKETQTQREFKETMYAKMRRIVESKEYVRYTGEDIREVVDATMNQKPPVYVDGRDRGRQI